LQYNLKLYVGKVAEKQEKIVFKFPDMLSILSFQKKGKTWTWFY